MSRVGRRAKTRSPASSPSQHPAPGVAATQAWAAEFVSL